MKRVWAFILLAGITLAEENSLSLYYTSFDYGNHPNNHFTSLYLDTGKTLSFYAGDLDLHLGLNALAVLGKSDDFHLFESIESDKALITSLSLDYYPTYQTLLGIGRHAMKLNLLNGSFDGILAAGEYDTLSVRAFYFDRYALLYPSYYINRELDDLFGIYLHYERGMLEGELTCFSYDAHQVSDLYLALHTAKLTLGMEHLSFDSDLYENEKAYKTSLGYRHQKLYAELGYYSVYEGALEHIFDLGGSEFRHFRLHGFHDKYDAKNLYLDLIYTDRSYYADLYIGHTEFAYRWEPEHSYTNKELGVTLGWRSEDVTLSATLLTQKSDEPWAARERTTWIQTQLKVRF